MSSAETTTPDWGRLPDGEGDRWDDEREATEARRSRPRREPEPAQPDPYGPGSQWEREMAKAKDLDDEGRVRQLWREREEAEDRAEADRAAMLQIEQDQALAERHGWSEYRAETERLAASDDPEERDAAADRLPFGAFVAQAQATEVQQQVYAATTASMDAEGAHHGYLPGGAHPDADVWVRALERRAGEADRAGDPASAIRFRQQASDRRAEIRENPSRLNTTAPGSQAVPGEGVDHPQPLDQRIADAQAHGQATGDWSTFDRLQVEAVNERGR